MRPALLSLLAISLPLLVFGYVNPPNNFSNNPPDYQNCTDCHGSYPLNGGNGSINLSGLPQDGFIPAQTYNLILTLADPGQSRWAFEITSEYLSGSNWLQAGNFTITQSNYTQLSVVTGTAPDYVKNTSAGTFQGNSGPVSWRFDWTAPDASVQSVGFYFAGAACNGSGTGGDFIYADSIIVDQYTPPPPQPPVVSDIPDQTIPYFMGAFIPIVLDTYVDDPDTPDSLVTWTVSAGEAIHVDIVDRVATISVVLPDWWGSETITFIATDPTSLSDSDDVVFTVTALPPVVSDIPGQTILLGESFIPINLSDYVEDPDTPDWYLLWLGSGSPHFYVEIYNQVAVISPVDSTWIGSDIVTFTAIDETYNSDSDTAVFTIMPLSVEPQNPGQTPTDFALNPAYPNPFNPETTISFALPYSGQVELTVFDSNGRQLRNLYSGELAAGYYNVRADMRTFASGIYLVSMKSGDFSAVQKIVLVK